MKRLTCLLAVMSLVVTLAVSVPSQAREKSPPGKEILASAFEAFHVDASFEVEIVTETCNVTQTNAASSVQEDFAINQKYASHNSDVAFAPLYRRQINEVLIKDIRVTNERKIIFKPDKIPK